MKAGYVELLGEGLNPRKYVETRLFQSDSLIGSNISYGYFGTHSTTRSASARPDSSLR